MEHMMDEKISKSIRNQNQCNSNEDQHRFEESPLGNSCEEIVIKVSSPALKLIDLVTHTKLKSITPHSSCSPSSPSHEYYLVKSTNDYVITNPTNDLGLVNI